MKKLLLIAAILCVRFYVYAMEKEFKPVVFGWKGSSSTSKHSGEELSKTIEEIIKKAENVGVLKTHNFISRGARPFSYDESIRMFERSKEPYKLINEIEKTQPLMALIFRNILKNPEKYNDMLEKIRQNPEILPKELLKKLEKLYVL